MNNLKNDTHGDQMPEIDELSQGDIPCVDFIGAMKISRKKEEELIDLSLDDMFKLCQELLYDKELLKEAVKCRKNEIDYLNEVIQKKGANG